MLQYTEKEGRKRKSNFNLGWHCWTLVGLCEFVHTFLVLESVMFWPSLSNHGWLHAWLTRYSTWLTRCVAVCGIFSHLSMPVVGFMLGWLGMSQPVKFLALSVTMLGFMLGWLGMSQPVKFLAVSRWPCLASCLADWVCHSLWSFWLSLSDGGWFEAWLATGTAVWQVSARPPGTRTRSCQRTTSASTGRATSSCWRRRSWKQSWPTAWRWVEPREGLTCWVPETVVMWSWVMCSVFICAFFSLL